MKRSEFLKRLGLGVVAIPLAPTIARELMNDEAGVMSDGVEPLWNPKDPEYSLEQCRRVYSHFEEDRVHDTQPWPLRMNDVILLPNERTYVVTAERHGVVTLTPFEADQEVIYAKRGDEMIRFSNLKSQL